MDLAGVTEELYSGAPEAFVARRTELAREARAAKDRPLAQAITALRRPTRGAWLVNQLARSDRPALEDLLALGPQLAQMHTEGTPEQLRELTMLRRQAVDALVRRAVQLAAAQGYRATDAARWEVQVTLEAALAHPEAAGQVLGGCLVATPESAASFPLDLFTAPLHLVGKAAAQAAETPVPVGSPADSEVAGAAPADDDPVADVVDIHAAARRREHERAVRAATTQLEAARAELARAQGDAQAAQGEVAVAEKAVVEATVALEAAQARRTTLAGERDELLARLAVLEQELAGATSDEAAQRLAVDAAHGASEAAARIAAGAAAAAEQLAARADELARALQEVVDAYP